MRTISIMLTATTTGMPSSGELSGQIKVTLEVGAVDDVEYRIGALAEQEVTRDDLLKGVRGKRIDARKVNDRYAVKLLELAFLFSQR